MKEIGEGATMQINPTSIESISYAMVRLYNDPELLKTLITKGFEKQALFSWDKTANLFWQSCLKVLSE
jgi:hypothetical protein